jgi:hypothetical protein
MPILLGANGVSPVPETGPDAEPEAPEASLESEFEHPTAKLATIAAIRRTVSLRLIPLLHSF